MTTIVLAICCAAVAACCFAGAATLQHGAVRVFAAAGQSLGARAFRQMMRSRRWQAGTGLAVTGSGLHVTALSQAPLVIVQPIGVLSLVVTVLLGTRASGIRVGPVVRTAVTGVCAGTGGFVVLATLAGTTPTGPVPIGPILLVVTGALTLTAIGLTLRGRTRCLVLAMSSALLFGTGSAVIRTGFLIIAHSALAGIGLALLATIVMVTGGWAQHQAYTSGPPALVIATTTVIDPLAAVLIGIGFYGEAARTSPTATAIEVALALIAGAAVVVLARSVPCDLAHQRPRQARAEPRQLTPAA